MCPNPCSNGIWSATDLIWEYGTVQEVLILVLMEYGLRPASDIDTGSIEYKS